jgi:hypothetical protein
VYSRFSACRRGRRRLRRGPPREPIRGPSPPGAAGAERGRWLRSPYSTRRRMPWAFSPCLQVFDGSAPIASRGVLNRSGDVNHGGTTSGAPLRQRKAGRRQAVSIATTAESSCGESRRLVDVSLQFCLRLVPPPARRGECGESEGRACAGYPASQGSHIWIEACPVGYKGA